MMYISPMSLSLGWLDTLKLYLSYPFVRYALIAGVLISLCAGLLGVTLVLKRYSMIGDGLSHVAFGAMAIAAVTGLAPMTVALPVTVAAAVLLLLANERGLIKGDAAIAMLSAGALAVGYLLLNLFPSPGTGSLSGDVCSSLFGSTSMMTLSPSDVWLCVILCAVVLGFFILCYHRIFAVTFDQTFATATGLSSRVYNFAIAAVSGVVIVMAMKLVGALLISALIIFPALTSMRVCKRFKSVIICSAIVSALCFFAGICSSYALSTPAGASVVVANLIAFLVFAAVGAIRDSMQLRLGKG